MPANTYIKEYTHIFAGVELSYLPEQSMLFFSADQNLLHSILDKLIHKAWSITSSV